MSHLRPLFPSSAFQINEVYNESVNWKTRALKAEAKLEAAELVVLYVQDLINMWPSVTFRTIVRVTEKIAVLKDAVKEYSSAGKVM